MSAGCRGKFPKGGPCATYKTETARQKCKTRVSAKIRKLMQDEGMDQQQAVAVALSMEGAGRLGPRGGYQRAGQGRRAVRYDRLPEPEPLEIKFSRRAPGHRALGHRAPSQRTPGTMQCWPDPKVLGPSLPGSLCVQVHRRIVPPELAGKSLTTPGDVRAVAQALARAWEAEAREWFLVLVLDTRHRVWGWFPAAVGTETFVHVYPQQVLQAVVASGRGRFVVVHNHPSGDPTPSAEDKEITTRLQRGAEMLGLQLLDHVVLGSSGQFTSFRELGWL